MEDEIQKCCSQPDKYQKAIPEKTKKEVGTYSNIYGTTSFFNSNSNLRFNVRVA